MIAESPPTLAWFRLDGADPSRVPQDFGLDVQEVLKELR
jgi:hypothetical protein